MTQIILDTENANIELPESRKNGYSVTRTPLYSDVEMISGRITREFRGFVYETSYQYGYFTDEQKNLILATVEKGIRTPITCGILLQDNTMIFSDFLVTNIQKPKFMWGQSKDGSVSPLWMDFSFTMREVNPSD